jgi:hypothetical protein
MKFSTSLLLITPLFLLGCFSTNPPTARPSSSTTEAFLRKHGQKTDGETPIGLSAPTRPSEPPPHSTISGEDLASWRGRTFGELKERFGPPTTSTTGFWNYRPRNLANGSRENLGPINVVNKFAGTFNPHVQFMSRGMKLITPSTIIFAAHSFPF